jgi:DNA-binding transcriptional ArsR family regulator
MPTDEGPFTELDQAQLDAAERFMSDPLRRRILGIMAEQPEFTINQLAERLGETPRRIRHALDALIEARLVSVAGERSRRGTIERAYSGVRLPFLWEGEWPRVDDFVRRQINLDTARSIFGDVGRGLSGDSFGENREWHLVRFWRELDEQGFEELLEIHRRAFAEVAAAYERAEVRIGEGAERSVPVMSALLLFEVAHWDQEDGLPAGGPDIADDLPED